MTKAEQKAKKLLAAAVKKAKVRDDDQQFILSRGKVRELERKQTFVITCAQNNTDVEPKFWKALQGYAKEHDAQLFVIPVRYKNPTTKRDPQEGDPNANYWWPPELHPYLVDNEVRIHKNCRVMADHKIGATIANPLGGLEGQSRGASAIYGHAQVQMRTVPTPQGEMPMILHTTGSVSRKNYADNARAKKALLHHTNGALVVQKRGRLFHIRHLNWSAGHQCFHDLGRRYTATGSYPVKIKALVLGDWHAIWTDPKVRAATKRMIAELKPETLVWHDVLDSYSITHHHNRDPITRMVKHHAGKGNIEIELELTAKSVLEMTPIGVQSVIVASNHHDHLLRWLKEADPKRDPENALLYHRLMVSVLERAKMTTRGTVIPDPFALWFHLTYPSSANVRFLKRNESFRVEEVELGFHGDIGSGGARGSRVSFSKLGCKPVIGHLHSPGIEKGCTQVGTSTELGMEYTFGPGGWLNTHCAVHANGKRQLYNIIRGEYR